MLYLRCEKKRFVRDSHELIVEVLQYTKIRVCHYQNKMVALVFPAKPGKPAMPEIVKVDKDSVTLTYKPPGDDGGSEIFNYVIEYRIEGGYKWVRANEKNVTDLKYMVRLLKEGNDYEFRVSAENRAGVGPPSEPTSPVEAKEQICESC